MNKTPEDVLRELYPWLTAWQKEKVDEVMNVAEPAPPASTGERRAESAPHPRPQGSTCHSMKRHKGNRMTDAKTYLPPELVKAEEPRCPKCGSFSVAITNDADGWLWVTCATENCPAIKVVWLNDYAQFFPIALALSLVIKMGKEAADDKLAFDHAEEVVGKLEADVARLTKLRDAWKNLADEKTEQLKTAEAERDALREKLNEVVERHTEQGGK